jgi:hypothetical protein
MHHEKLYKNHTERFLLTCFDGFLILNMNHLYGSVLSSHNKNVWKTFSFAIGIFYAALVELSMVHLSKKHQNKLIGTLCTAFVELSWPIFGQKSTLSFSQVEIHAK